MIGETFCHMCGGFAEPRANSGLSRREGGCCNRGCRLARERIVKCRVSRGERLNKQHDIVPGHGHSSITGARGLLRLQAGLTLHFSGLVHQVLYFCQRRTSLTTVVALRRVDPDVEVN